MSLILEALRKLEREKQTPERGFLVLGTGAWAERGAAGRPFALFLLGLLVGALALGMLTRSGSAPAPSAAAVIAAPTAAPPTPHAVPPPTSVAGPALPLLTAATITSTSPPPPPGAGSTLAAKPTAPKFTLQAISEKDGHSVALINDRLLRAGDAVDGARVVAIAADSVELEIGGRRVVLRF